jgi:hypothetical protein
MKRKDSNFISTFQFEFYIHLTQMSDHGFHTVLWFLHMNCVLHSNIVWSPWLEPVVLSSPQLLL